MFAPKYTLFFDNHTQEQIYDYAFDFDAVSFVDQVRRCGVDFLTVHARCNRGYTYYPSRIGLPHPALQQDMLGNIACACEKQGIRLAAYFNGGLSGAEAVKNPSWQARGADGRTLLTEDESDPFAVRMCLNSPYRQHLISMIREVLKMYPYISGIFIDCIHDFPCYCPVCKEKAVRLGIASQEELGAVTAAEFCAEVGEAVRQVRPGCELFYNSNNTFRYAGSSNTFLDCECLPTAGWGYECLPTLVHWAPELCPGKPVLNMTGRFYDWGDFGGLRSVNSLSCDLFYGLMHGMRPEIGGHFNPKGQLDVPVFDTIAATYEKLRRFEPYYTSAPRQNDIAVVLSSEKELQRLYKPVRAAVRMLEELKLPFSVITEADRSLESFKLLILPENTEFPDHLVKRLNSFKGAVIGCGTEMAAKLGDFFGICFKEKAVEPAYYDAPGMALSIYSGADCVTPLDNVSNEGAVVRPYCSPGFVNGMAVCYCPPEKNTPYPFVTVKDNHLFCAGHIFSGYYTRAGLHLRELLQKFISRFLPSPQIKTENLYSFTRISFLREEERLIVCLLNFVPESRGEAFAVEDEVELNTAGIAVRLDGFEVQKVLWGEERQEIPFKIEEGYCKIMLPPFKGFTALEITGSNTKERR